MRNSHRCIVATWDYCEEEKSQGAKNDRGKIEDKGDAVAPFHQKVAHKKCAECAKKSLHRAHILSCSADFCHPKLFLRVDQENDSAEWRSDRFNLRAMVHFLTKRVRFSFWVTWSICRNKSAVTVKLCEGATSRSSITELLLLLFVPDIPDTLVRDSTTFVQAF